MFWFVRLLKLPPLVYLGIAPLGLLFAGYLYFEWTKDEAAKAAALAGKPPAVVKIEDFNPGRDTGKADEVVIVAQINPASIVDLSQTKKGRERDHWVIGPLYPTTAKAESGPASGLMIQHGTATDEQLQKMVVGEGPFGPLIQLNGISVKASSERTAIDEATKRVTLKPDAIYIDPFESGRAEGLGPNSSGRDVSLALLVVSLLVAAYGAFRYFSERNTDQLADAEPDLEGHH
jgi:hypothetical protein